jgi:hypothetical protein
MGAVEGSDTAAFEGARLPALPDEPQPPHHAAADVLVEGQRIGVPLTSPTLLLRLLLEYWDRPLPGHLYAALSLYLTRQIREDRFHELHVERWALMHYALDTLHKRWEKDEALRWCSQQLKRRGRPASPATVLSSYNKIEKEQRGLGRGRPRTYRSRRPRTYGRR